MSTLADINKNLDEQDKALDEISENTGRTSRAIDRFVAFMEGKKYDDLEAQRELTKAVNRPSSQEARSQDRASSKPRGPGLFENFDSKSLLTGAGLTALGTTLFGGLAKRGIPAAIGLTFADEIGNYVESATGKAELGAAAERATIGGSFGLLLGKRFGLLGAAIGALADDKNMQTVTDIGKNLEKSFTEFAENLGLPIPSLESLQTAVGNGLTGIKALTEGDFTEFRENFAETAGLLGMMGLLIAPGPFLRMMKSLAAFGGKPLGRKFLLIAGAVAAGTFVYDRFFSDIAGDIGMDDVTGGAALAAGGAAAVYGGAKAIQSRRGPSTAEIEEMKQRNSQMPKPPKVVGTIDGKNVVRSKAGNLTYAGADGKATTQVVSEADAKRLKPSGPKWYNKFPRIKGLRNIPGTSLLFAALDSALAAGIMLDDSLTQNQKIEQLGPLIGGAVGALGFGALGTIVGGPVGGSIGALAGYLGGDWAGTKLATYLLGKEEAPITPSDRSLIMSGNNMSGTAMDESYNPTPAPKVIKPDVASQSAAIDAYAGSNSAIMRNGMAGGGMAVGQIGDNTSIINDTTPILPSLNSDVFDTNGMLWSP